MTQAVRYNVRSLTRLSRAAKARRLELDMSQQELADLADVSRKWVSNFEKADVEGLELTRVLRVLDALEFTLYAEAIPVDRNEGAGTPPSSSRIAQAH